MNISLSFTGYAAINSLRDVGPTSVALLSTAKLGKGADNRRWILDGHVTAFEALLGNINEARHRALSSGMSSALADVGKAIEDGLGAGAAATAAAALKGPPLPTPSASDTAV